MSGNRNSGRRPKIERPNFGGPPKELARPRLSPGAATHWPIILEEAQRLGAVTAGDGPRLAMLCELFGTLDFVARAKSRKAFSPFSAKGLRVLRVERQTSDAIERAWKKLKTDLESRGGGHGARRPSDAPAAPSIREFARQKGPAGA